MLGVPLNDSVGGPTTTDSKDNISGPEVANGRVQALGTDSLMTLRVS